MVGIVFHDLDTETVEGRDMTVIGGDADHVRKSCAHGPGAGLGEGEGEDGVGIHVGLAQDIGHAQGDGLGLAGAWASDDHDGSIDGVDSFFLFSV